MRTAVDTKDLLLAMLNGDELSVMEYLERAEKVLFFLDTARGLFNELGYAYKGKEIASHIEHKCWLFLAGCSHALTIKRITAVREKAWLVVESYHDLVWQV